MTRYVDPWRGHGEPLTRFEIMEGAGDVYTKALCYVHKHRFVAAGCAHAEDGFACTAALIANNTVHVDDGSGRGAPATCDPLEPVIKLTDVLTTVHSQLCVNKIMYGLFIAVCSPRF